MRKFTMGFDAIDILKGRNSLRDSTLTSLRLSDVNGECVLDCCFNLKTNAEFKSIRLRFSGILEFGFYYSNQFSFYNVEALKFFVSNEGWIYLSLDPDELVVSDSKTDQDFVKAKGVELIIES